MNTRAPTFFITYNEKIEKSSTIKGSILKAKMWLVLRGIIRRRLFKSFSSTATRQTKIPDVILDELRDTSKLPSRNNGSKKELTDQILILDPNQTVDKRYMRHLDSLKLRAKPEIIPSKPPKFDITTEDLRIDDDKPYINDISRLRPANDQISKSRHLLIIDTLLSSFNRPQLLDYIKMNWNSKEKKSKISKLNKKSLSKFIIDQIWSVKVNEELSPLDDLLIKESVELSNLDLFLLLTQNGIIIKQLSGAVYKIKFDPLTKSLSFIGTDRQVENAKINLSHFKSKANHETIDLSSLKKLFIEKFGEFSIKEIGENTEVFFHHLSQDKYELVALNKNQLKRMKRLLLWLLNYNLHTSNNLLLPESLSDLHLLPYKDDDVLQWNDRSKSLYRLKTSNQIPNAQLLNNLDKFSNSNMLSSANVDYDDLKLDFDNAKSLPKSLISADRILEDESWGLLKSLGIGSDDMNETAKTPEAKVAEPENQRSETSGKADVNASNVLDQSTRDNLYNQLTDFSYQANLIGLPKNQLITPIMTVTLGNILFNKPKNNESQPIPPTVTPTDLNQESNFIFNSNIPLANDKLLTLPLYNYPSLSKQDLAHFINEDPHNYSVQLKFVPTPFMEELSNDSNINNDLSKQTKYPPIEIWCELNQNSVPDIDTMQIMTAEGENNTYIALPNETSDLKVSCHLSGNVLHQDECTETSESSNDDLEDILNETTKRNSRFKNQPGIIRFLEKSKLDFSGRVTNSIESYMDVSINGTMVRYHYVNVAYRRKLEFNYSNNRLVEFNIVEGGGLGGRKVEVNFVGDFLNDLNKDDFNNLLNDSIMFIKEM